MSNFKLNLPTDISWERICVTEDMMDRVVCDERLPSKWNTSLAAFKYRPEEEFQMYPHYDITYLKVTATITGYQPLDKEIQGKINWHGLNVATIPALTDLLNSYNPCHGAILQVIVGPKDKESKLALKDYPYFIDFEPKKRELYETATDTHERQSRSIEKLNVTNATGSTQSMEVFDVDMGSSVSASGQASFAGTGGGFGFSSSNQGQWGTKRLNADESMSSRSTDVGQEKRESFSYSTQLSQMYHLLDSYHLGTNRIAFFIQPRPHVLEEPSGFVRGPRPVDGIQEFFVVVAQPKGQDDFCLSLRLDTSHLTKTPIMDYDRKSDVSEMASATAPIPTKSDTLGKREKWGEACFFDCWDMYYQCYLTHDEDDKVYTAPAGYIIEGYNNLVNSSSHGSTSVTISPNQKTLTIHAEANGKRCFEDTFGCVDCPDEWQTRSGSARRQVQVNLVSTDPIKQVGEEDALMITTRGLCCCPSRLVIRPEIIDEFIVGVRPIPGYLKPKRPRPEFSGYFSTTAFGQMDTAARETRDRRSKKAQVKSDSCENGGEQEKQSAEKYSIRQANELSNYIKIETIRSLNDPTVELKKFIDTDFFVRQMTLKVSQFKKGRELLSESVANDVPRQAVKKLERYFRKRAEDITRHDLLSLRNEELTTFPGINKAKAQELKLMALGVIFNEDYESGKTKETK